MSNRRHEAEPPPFAPIGSESKHSGLDLTFDKGLPSNPDAERLVLGVVLLNDEHWKEIEGLPPDVWSMESHRRIFAAMLRLAEDGKRIDRIVLAEELSRSGHLESIGGLSYLLSLDEGTPDLPKVGDYVRIIQEKSTLRKLIFGAQKVIDRCLIGQDEPGAIALGMEKIGKDLVLQPGKGEEAKRVEQIILEYPGGIGAMMDPNLRERGLQTGFTKYDEMTGGLHPGEVTILAARPSVGKTALAMNIAQHIATHPKIGKPVVVFSLEMSGSSLLTRMMCSAARVDQHKFRAGYLNQDERRKLQVVLEQLRESLIFIDDTPGITVHEIAAKVRRLKERYGLALAVIDYLQLIASSSRRSSDSRNQDVSDMSRSLKVLAGEVKIPFLVLSQLSRAPEMRRGDHVPQLSDLRDSGSIEQDADNVAFIYREEQYKRDREDLKGLADIIVAKQRNGPIGKVPLRFIGAYTRFENRADDELPEYPGEAED